jgi:hypothetical protein
MRQASLVSWASRRQRSLFGTAPTDFCNRLIEPLSAIRSGSRHRPAAHDGYCSKEQGSSIRAMIHEFV